MRKTLSTKREKVSEDKREKVSEELLPEYDFDYSKGLRNPYASRFSEDRVVVLLDKDLSAVFRTPGSVNKALREYLVLSSTKNRRSRTHRNSAVKQT